MGKGDPAGKAGGGSHPLSTQRRGSGTSCVQEPHGARPGHQPPQEMALRGQACTSGQSPSHLRRETLCAGGDLASLKPCAVRWLSPVHGSLQGAQPSGQSKGKCTAARRHPAGHWLVKTLGDMWLPRALGARSGGTATRPQRGPGRSPHAP